MSGARDPMPDLECVLNRIDKLRDSLDGKIDGFRSEFTEVSAEWISVCRVGNERITKLEQASKDHERRIESIKERVIDLEKKDFADQKQIKTIAKTGAVVWAVFAGIVVAGWELWKYVTEIVAINIIPK